MAKFLVGQQIGANEYGDQRKLTRGAFYIAGDTIEVTDAEARELLSFAADVLTPVDEAAIGIVASIFVSNEDAAAQDGSEIDVGGDL